MGRKQKEVVIYNDYDFDRDEVVNRYCEDNDIAVENLSDADIDTIVADYLDNELMDAMDTLHRVEVWGWVIVGYCQTWNRSGNGSKELSNYRMRLDDAVGEIVSGGRFGFYYTIIKVVGNKFIVEIIHHDGRDTYEIVELKKIFTYDQFVGVHYDDRNWRPMVNPLGAEVLKAF